VGGDPGIILKDCHWAEFRASAFSHGEDRADNSHPDNLRLSAFYIQSKGYWNSRINSRRRAAQSQLTQASGKNP